MAFCPSCGAQIEDGAITCPKCGNGLATQQPLFTDPKDHTSEYDFKDISDNKVFAMAAVLLNIVGVLIALLAAQKSPYAMFHARQSLKITMCEVLCVIMMIIPILGWIAAGICWGVLFVVRVILFFQICKGKAKDAPIVGSLSFLR